MTRGWWDGRWTMAALALLAAVPLLWPDVPPLTDLPGHIGRFRIMAEAGIGPLARHYAVEWRPVGNFGVDAAVLLLAPWTGVEAAAKLVVLAIPPLTVAALLWLARETHGRVPAATLFALPLAYAAPLQLGFVNFALATALLFALLALWLRLARTWRDGARAALFVPLAGLLWLCHAFGWAMLGVFAFGLEWALRRERGEGAVRAGVMAAAMCAPMALPVAVLLLSGAAGPGGGTGEWFDLPAKAFFLVSVLRERWQWWDAAGAGALLLLLFAAWRSPLLSFSLRLGVPALLGAALFAALPFYHAGASFVDARLLPATLALAIASIRPADDAGMERRLAIGGGAFFLGRLAVSTAALAMYAQGWTPVLRMAERLPVGASVLVLVNEPAADAWENPRLAHIAGLATARRRVFTNEQWAIPGQQLIRPLHPRAAPFDRDPSHLIYPASVRERIGLDEALARFDRGTFGYVWAIGFPPGRADRPDLAPVARDGGSVLYRVTPRG